VASQQADAPTLPATGVPAHLLASAGALLFASGAALRRRAS
jgi:LPXTG-motif cell wall-anchored protein